MCQRSSGGTPEGTQAKRPKKTGKLSYAKAAQEGLRMAIICDWYPEVPISTENLINIRRKISGLVHELSDEGFTLTFLDTY
jgi:hypothetical protein